MKAGHLYFLLAAVVALTAEAANRGGYLPAIGPGPLRWQKTLPTTVILPPLIMTNPGPEVVRTQPAGPELVKTNSLNTMIEAVSPGFPVPTNQLAGTNVMAVVSPTTPPRVPSLINLLPFFERTGTNGVIVTTPVFLPPQGTLPPASSSSKYLTP